MTKQRKIIDSYLAGNYPEDVSRDFVFWYDAPVDQKIKQDELLASWEALEVKADPKDITDAYESVKRRLDERRLGRLCFQKLRRPFWQIAAAVAVLLITVGTTLLIDRVSRPDGHVEWLDAYCPYGKTMTISLPDGSSITLNAGSRLVYPTAFTGDARKVFLSGEAFADITKDPKKKFEISANELDITVHGTSFNVRSYPGDSEAEVILFSGSIDLNTKSQTRSRKISMTPGDVARIERSNGSIAVEDFSTESFRGDARLVFVNTRLIDIAAQFERVFDVNLVIRNPEIAQQRYLASFINGESLDEILTVLTKTGKIRYRKSETTDTVYID